MRDLRQSLILHTFLLCCLSTALFSFSKEARYSSLDSQTEEVVKIKEEAFFKQADCYIYKQQKPFHHLQADEIKTNLDNGLLDSFATPRGFFIASNDRPIHYKARKGTWWKKKRKLHLKESVAAHMDDSRLVSQEMIYFFDEDKIVGKKDVRTKTISEKNGDRIFVNSDTLIAWPGRNEFYYEGNVTGELKREKPYEPGMEFRSDKLNLFVKQLEAKMAGNVHINKKNFKAYSQKGRIFLKNYNKRLKYFVLNDDVKVIQKIKTGPSSIQRRGFSERLEGIMSEDKYVLTGSPKVHQGNDIIRGTRIVLQDNNSVIMVDDSNINFSIR